MKARIRKPFAERLQAGLEEMLAHARGELTLKTIVHLDSPPEIDAKTLVALRTESEMSQAVFAEVLSTSTKTIQSWEQGVRVPSRASRRLIQIFVEQPEAVCKVVGLRPIQIRGFTIQPIGNGKRRIVKEPA